MESASQPRSVRASIWQEGGLYVAQCLEVDVASQGATREEALASLREALELFFEDPRPTLHPEIASIEIEPGAA